MSDRPLDRPSEAPRPDKATVFVSDPSVEAERVSQALRSAEFHVVDVPLSMLVARVAVQRPRVVILDADAEGALDTVARMRELPDAEGIDVLFCGRPGAVLNSTEDALAHEGSGFFPRPVNVSTLLKKIESLVAGGEAKPEAARAEDSRQEPSSAAPSGAPATTQRSKPPSRPPSRPPPGSIPPPSRPPASRPPPGSVPPPSLRAGALSQRVAPPSTVSPELKELLALAEQRVAADPSPSDAPPSPEEELEAVLPEEVLAALDAPIDDDEPEEAEGPSRVITSSGRAATGPGVAEPAPAAEHLTSDGTGIAHQTQGEPPAAPTTGGGASRGTEELTAAHRSARLRTEPPGPGQQPFGVDPSASVTTPPRRSSSVPPSNFGPLPSALSSTLGSELLVQQGGMLAPAPLAPFGVASASSMSQPTPTPAAAQVAPSMPRPSIAQPQPPSRFEAPPSMNEPSVRAGSVQRAAAGPYALGPTDAPRVLAQSIASRQTGALTFDTPRGVRRIVLREGDVVTAASGIDSESLLAFLGARGDLPRERVEALAGRLPPNGRHAGAALVAQGVLGQDQLWPVLRAHAEYLMGQAILVDSGTAFLDAEPPGRLKTEPSVFGGAPGAEVLLEVVRRVFDNAEAVRRCGGGASIVGEGPRPELLRECGLGAAEVEAIQGVRGRRIDAIVETYPQTDIASVIYALWLLGVVDMVRSVLEPQPRGDAAPDAIDEEAVRARVRARVQLVEEGDYFALLGVPHNATGYEVRRAYLDLRRAFESSRILTPGLIDLAEDVRRITTVLEEAYEILGDNARRERYRRAIEDAPREA